MLRSRLVRETLTPRLYRFGVRLRFRRSTQPADTEILCTFLATTLAFDSTCPLTLEQVRAWEEGRMFGDLLDSQSNVEETADLVPAFSLIFSDGFESGDTSRWSSEVP